MQTVYLDVLFCVNFVIDYIMLCSCRMVLSLHTGRLRMLLSASVGGLGSFVLLLPPLPFAASLAISIAQAGVMIAAAFAPIPARTFIKASGLLFGISFCFFGAMTAVMTLFTPKNTIVRNSAVYIGIPPLLLVALTLAFYFMLRLFYRFLNRGSVHSSRCDAVIEYHGIRHLSSGIIDTGNTLHEPFSGKCVIVGSEKAFKEMFDAQEYLRSDGSYPDRSIRLVPYSSVGGSGLMPSFRPSRITVISEKKEYNVDAYLALSHQDIFSQGCELIVPAELIMKGS